MHKNWLKYWENSLSDSQRMLIDFEKENYKMLKNFSIDSGFIPLDITNELFISEEKVFNKKKKITNSADPNWMKLENLNVLISLFTIVRIPEHFENNYHNKPSHPFWISVTLTRDGELTPSEKRFPVIPRPYLSPSAGESYDFIFSDVDKLDLASAISSEDTEHWNDYWNYLEKVFDEITKQKLEEYQIEGYRKNNEVIIFSPNNENGAASSIINLYQHFIEAKKLPLLLKNVISIENKDIIKPLEVNKYVDKLSLHLGQMSDSFPLSISQRKTFNTFLTSKKNSVFAVNGPPGTGKTTLLQSIVANEIVTAAIKGKDAPIILACSSNNQAVTNINESFSKAESTLGNLNGRWLPDFDGFASYLPAKNKNVDDLHGINYFKLDGSGTFQLLENEKYIRNAEKYFLRKLSKYKSQNFTNVKQAANVLQEDIKAIKIELETLSLKWKAYVEACTKFKSEYKSLLSIDEYLIEGNTNSQQKIKSDLSWFIQAETRTLDYFKNESFFRKVGCFFGVKKSLGLRFFEIERIQRESPVGFSQTQINSKLNSLLFINEQIRILTAIKGEIELWHKVKKQNKVNANPPQKESELWKYEWHKKEMGDNTPNYFYDELDVLHRHKAFQLAVHYWEARWLMSVKIYLKNPRRDKKGYRTTVDRFKLRSMLTPCYVSTFYMAPKFISYWSFDEENESWANPPITGLVDLLMVDEAGQTTPEVGTAIFGLANKAIVVGDVNQIEPIWSIPSKIDICNLDKNKLLLSEKQESYRKLREIGNLASNGSIMKMAQNATEYKEEDTLENGLLLREHRRCYDEIIDYCNQLAYNGQLIPMKGKKINNKEFPAIGLMHVEGNSVVRNKDRFNIDEAIAIAAFLMDNKSKIEVINGKSVEEEVGIITPFVGQKKEIIKAMRTSGFRVGEMKIGTVHALQGAERSIIIFSSVYGDGDVGTMFFDRDNKPNMLNVAVSRAKESFLVFGDEKIFNPTANTPSGKLATYLKTHDENINSVS